MWFVTGLIRGDGDRLRQQSPEFPLVNLSILRASFYKNCRWRWTLDIDWCGWVLSWVRGALSPSLSLSGNAGLWSKGFMLAIDTASTYPEIQLLYTGLMTPGKICYKVYQLAMIDPCIADFPENLLPLWRDLSLWHIPWRWYYPSHIGKCTGLLFL